MRRADLSKDVEDDCSLCGCLTSCGENIVALFDLEKLLYPLFFNHYRNLRREKLLRSWLLSVTVPFYASVVLVYTLFQKTSPDFDPDGNILNQQSPLKSYAVNMLFILVVPMTVISFGHGVIADTVAEMQAGERRFSFMQNFFYMQLLLAGYCTYLYLTADLKAAWSYSVRQFSLGSSVLGVAYTLQYVPTPLSSNGPS